MKNKINVFGAGLAGSEAAWQAAKLGVHVDLYEMKPKKFSPAHHSENFAELVCSNSLRSNQLSNAVGLLKAELATLDSLIMESAERAAVPAGSALAVDRNAFSAYITEKIKNNSLITIHNEEVVGIPDDEITVVATGPLTSDDFSDYLAGYLGKESLHFFDAAAPIVDASTIDTERAYYASRYGKGDACYINCPMNKEEYLAFYEALITAREAPLKSFDRDMQSDLTVFEGCMPVEVMAKRGVDTLLFGPLKPVGLPDPKTGKEPYAVVQLRQENIEKTMYNIVGFQTHLAFDEQKRVFSMIPGLQNASFLRYGVMHRNSFINSPELLSADYSLRSHPNVFFAGQMTGVEGYIESTSSGFVAGLNAARRALGKDSIIFPSATAIGALAKYVSSSTSASFQPMNVNFGIIDPLTKKVKGGKSARNEQISARALECIKEMVETIDK